MAHVHKKGIDEQDYSAHLHDLLDGIEEDVDQTGGSCGLDPTLHRFQDRGSGHENGPGR